MAIEIQAPEPYKTGIFTIFLAGSIDMGSAEEWQKQVVDALADYDVQLLNPRRDDWDSSWKQEADDPQFSEQVNWEQDGLEKADFRIFYFAKESKAPITFAELGEFIDAPGIVMCPEGFYRKGNVDILCERNEMPLTESMDEMIAYVRKMLDEQGLKIAKRAAGPVPVTETPAFKAWFGNSVVVDEAGYPLVVYRGEHGEYQADQGFHSRHPSISFGGPETASLYAESPNHRDDRPVNPRVYPCYLRIQKPIMNDPYDPFIEFSAVVDALGEDAARHFALKHEDGITDTGHWMEELHQKYRTVEEMFERDPHMIRDVYMLAFPLLADPEFVQALKEKGYDGAIHGPYGEGDHDEPEYKIFDPSQAKSAIGNNGQFDPNNKSITAATTPVAPDTGFKPWYRNLPEGERRPVAPENTPRDITQTEAFRKWFAGSKVVDVEGNPLVAYHGTASASKQFLQRGNSAYAQLGHWFDADPRTVHFYAQGWESSHQPNLIPVFLSIEKPKNFPDLDYLNSAIQGKFGPTFKARAQKLRRDLKKEGYDGICVRNSVTSGSPDYWVAFDTEQIKSAIGNSGAFDAKDQSITASAEKLATGKATAQPIGEEPKASAPVRPEPRISKLLQKKV